MPEFGASKGFPSGKNWTNGAETENWLEYSTERGARLWAKARRVLALYSALFGPNPRWGWLRLALPTALGNLSDGRRVLGDALV